MADCAAIYHSPSESSILAVLFMAFEKCNNYGLGAFSGRRKIFIGVLSVDV